jgi:hypothetical protein
VSIFNLFSNRFLLPSGAIVQPLHRMALLVEIPSRGRFSIGFEPTLDGTGNKLIHQNTINKMSADGEETKAHEADSNLVLELVLTYCRVKKIIFQLVG